MKFVMNHSLYLGSKPVMWSPVEKTALAEAEVEYRDHQSHTIWVKFPVESYGTIPSGPPTVGDGELVFPDTSLLEDLLGAYVIIWTTTPWTIPSNRGVAFNPTIEYGLYEIIGTPDGCWARIGDRYLLADALAEEVMKQARLTPGMYRRLRAVSAEELAAVELEHPLGQLNEYWDYDVPVLPGDFVTDDAGTGFVHMAPSHGADDYELFVKNGLVDRMTHKVLEDSSFAPHVPFFAGLQVFDAKGKEGQRQPRRHRQAGRGRCAARPRPPDPLLPALLALQGAGDLPQHPAVVRRHRQTARGRHGHLRPHHPRARADLHRHAGANGPRSPAETGCTR